MHAVIISRTYGSADSRAKLRALRGLGAEVTALVPDRRGTQSVDHLMERDVRIVPITMRGELPDELRWSRKDIRNQLSALRADLVQIEEEPHSPLAALPAAEAGRAGVPYTIVTAQGDTDALAWRERRRRRAVLRKAAAWQAASGAAARALAAIIPQRPTIQAPQLGIAVPGRRVEERETFDIGFNARLGGHSGLSTLLKAVAGLAGPWALFVAGTGPELPEREAEAERLGIAGRIRWLGALPRQDQDAVRFELSCFVVPGMVDATGSDLSRSSALAAMAAGLPLVAAESRGLREIVDDDALLYAPGDVEALRVILQSLLDSPEERRRLGGAGRERIQREYSVDSVARRTYAHWTQLLTGV